MLFKHFLAIYLHKWTDQFVDEANLKAAMREWAIGLRGLTTQQINQALDLTRVNSNWPPAISEFVAYAMGPDLNEVNKDAYKLWVSRPYEKCDPDIARAEIESMRRKNR